VRSSTSQASAEDAIVQPDQQLAIPPEGRIVGPPQDEAHRVAVPTHEDNVRLTRLGRPVPGKDAMDLLHGDGNPFHGSGRRHRLGLEVAAQPTRPGAGQRAPVIESVPPAVQLLRQGLKRWGIVGKHHRLIMALI
jgi:hypothetical protein